MGLVALGVSGGIGAYKAVEIVRGLQDEGHSVVAILTRGALRFVGELTFEAITKRRVITDQFAPGSNADIEHISLASDIDASNTRPNSLITLALVQPAIEAIFFLCSSITPQTSSFWRSRDP